MKSKREEITEFEELLNKVISGDFNERKYLDVSEIVSFMQSDTKALKA